MFFCAFYHWFLALGNFQLANGKKRVREREKTTEEVGKEEEAEIYILPLKVTHLLPSSVFSPSPSIPPFKNTWSKLSLPGLAERREQEGRTMGKTAGGNCSGSHGRRREENIFDRRTV